MNMKRRRFIVNWKFQLQYSFVLILPVLILGLCVIASIFNISRSIIITQRQQLMTQIASLERSSGEIDRAFEGKAGVDLKNNVQNLKSFSHDLMNVNSFAMLQLRSIAVKGILVFIIGLLLFGIFYSHRIAGPIFRVQRFLEALDRDLNLSLKARNTDEFQDFFVALDKLRRQILQIKVDNEELAGRLIEKLGDIQSKVGPDIAAAIEEIKQESAKLRGVIKHIENYKV